MDILSIGKNTAELRKTKGVKQDELARFVGLAHRGRFSVSMLVHKEVIT